MSDPVLQVTDLGKSFRSYRRERHRFMSWFGISRQGVEEHWALQEVSFGLQPGETVGVVGPNGAGKSTLLKLITGTLRPTRGTIQARGRTSAILELGMGFHAEFTGRRNACHALGLLGFTRQETQQVLPEIRDFSELGSYFDQPVRTYSSGMQVRLAFAVATARRPDILIVDEALSVGDAYFQQKSFGRIRSFSQQGTTLLIVSHDNQAILSICHRALLLRAGRLVMEGEPERVMDYYNAMLSAHQNQTVRQEEIAFGKIRTVSGTGMASVAAVSLHNLRGQPIEVVSVGEPVMLKIFVKINQNLDSLVLGCGIKDRLGQMMFGTNTNHTGQKLYHLSAGSTYLFEVSFNANLGPGHYSVHTSLVKSDSHVEANYEWQDNSMIFEVVNKDKDYFVGCMWNEMKFFCCKIGG